MPLNREFSPHEIVDIIYPNSVSTDTEGRTFNRGIGPLFRMLRKIQGVVEFRKEKKFYAGLSDRANYKIRK